ncbi:hypothetical protein [Nocardiopsis dassonvillei]|uniref:hypothetical protein n=1 Tax=Nocardiopsis dassonvillei TaxID=2014 RepID=UPI00366DA8AA
MADRLVQLLIQNFGEEFIRYALALPEEGDIMQLIPQANAQALEVLEGSTAQLLAEDGNPVDFRLRATSYFSRFHESFGESLANFLHRLSGGEVEEIPTGNDPVVQSMRLLARDIWPVLMIKAPPEGPRTFWTTSTPGIIGNPRTNQACRDFLNDEHLSLLFPKAEGEEGGSDHNKSPIHTRAEWVINTGQSGTRYLISTLDSIIFYASVICRLNDGKLTQAGIMREIETSVGTFRTLATKKPASVPALIGFSGVSLAEGLESIKFSTGTLRSIRPFEVEFLFSSPERISSVYQTTFPVQILSISASSPDGSFQFKEWDKLSSRVAEAHRSFQRGINYMRLSLLLGSEPGKPIATSEVSRFVMDPLQFGGLSGWSADQRSPKANVITAEKSDVVVRWHSLIRDKHPDSLNISMKRILSAVSERWDAMDAFIDAVIVWENIFGTRSETTFRVTGSMAKMLDSSGVEARAELQGELKKLYEARSRLVHGAKELPDDVMWNHRNRAIDVSLELLRKLYVERPDLLAMNSEDRSKRVLLEG